MHKLAGKNILVLGGSGFIGRTVIQHALNHHAVVTGLSRKNPRIPIPGVQNWVNANILDTDTYISHIQKADIIVHSVGVLLDSTFMNSQNKPGDPGTYEQINRQSLKRVVDQSSKHGKKVLIYMSGQGRPPYLHRYQTTKQQAQDYLLSNTNINGIVIKPGFIHSQYWRLGLAYIIRVWRCFQPLAQKIIVNNFANSRMQDFIREFRVARPIALSSVVDGILGASMDEELYGKVLKNDQIEQLAIRMARKTLKEAKK